MARLGGGKGGGSIEFICLHCTKTYTSSYAYVRKHLCGIMPWDEGKTIGVKTCEKVLGKERNKYKKEEEAAQNKSKKLRVEFESLGSHKCLVVKSPFPHSRGFLPMRRAMLGLLD